MTTDQAKSLTESAIAALIDALDHGPSEVFTAYLRMLSRFHRYSWGNVLLIHRQQPAWPEVGPRARGDLRHP